VTDPGRLTSQNVILILLIFILLILPVIILLVPHCDSATAGASPRRRLMSLRDELTLWR
jgi:hypothetical protein